MTKMKTKLLPLKGKYYGTEIKIGDNTITIWGCNHTGNPSYREKMSLSCHGDISECDGDYRCTGKRCEAIDSSHYEDAGDLEIANRIVAALSK
jgi:hypothetical protein